jgi:hypothetical protein
MQGLFDGDGGDERAVGDSEEGSVGYPEHSPYSAGVGEGAEDGAEAAARGCSVEDDEHEDCEPGDQKRRKHEGDDEPEEGRVDEGEVELAEPDGLKRGPRSKFR